MERRTYTVAETAEILGVSTDVVYLSLIHISEPTRP